MTTITHTPDGPRFDGMTVGEIATSLDHTSAVSDQGDRLLAAAAAALRHLSEWQPIETHFVPGQAPWDGREYLVFGVNPDGEEWQAVGHWWAEDEEWHQEPIGEELPDECLYTPTYYRALPPGPMEATP